MRAHRCAVAGRRPLCLSLCLASPPRPHPRSHNMSSPAWIHVAHPNHRARVNRCAPDDVQTRPGVRRERPHMYCGSGHGVRAWEPCSSRRCDRRPQDMRSSGTTRCDEARANRSGAVRSIAGQAVIRPLRPPSSIPMLLSGASRHPPAMPRLPAESPRA